MSIGNNRAVLVGDLKKLATNDRHQVVKKAVVDEYIFVVLSEYSNKVFGHSVFHISATKDSKKAIVNGLV